MPDSPPRSPHWSAAAVARSSGGPNSTRHSTSSPGPGRERQQPPEQLRHASLGARDAHVEHPRAAQRLGRVLQPLYRPPPAAGAYSPGGRGATAIGWRSAAGMRAGAYSRRS